MRISVTLSLDVDPEAWDLEYGTGTAAKDVRADVQAHVRGTVHEHFRELGVLDTTGEAARASARRGRARAGRAAVGAGEGA
jgi:hypothetical protein